MRGLHGGLACAERSCSRCACRPCRPRCSSAPCSPRVSPKARRRAGRACAVVVGSVLLAGAAAAAVTIVSMTARAVGGDAHPRAAGRAVGCARDARRDSRRAPARGRRGCRRAAGRRRDVRRARRDGAQHRAARSASAGLSAGGARSNGSAGHVQLEVRRDGGRLRRERQRRRIERRAVRRAGDPRALGVALLAAHRGRQARRGDGHPHDHPVGTRRATTSRRPTSAKWTRSKRRRCASTLAFSGDLEVALDRLAADDLRGAELQLDEMQAIYGAGRPDLWSFYGYLYTVARQLRPRDRCL